MRRYGFSHRFEKQLLLGTDLVRPRERSVGKREIGENWEAQVA